MSVLRLLVLGLVPGSVAWALPIVQLEEAGEAPRKELRLAPTLGAAESVALVLDLVMGLDMGGGRPKLTNPPPFRIVLDGAVQERTPEGHYVYAFTLREGKVLPPPVDGEMSEAEKAELEKLGEQVKEEVARFVGTTGSLVLDARGRLVRSEVKPPAGTEGKAFKNLEKALMNALVPLPEEPVGVGARWTVTQPVEESGLSLKQTVSYTLTSLEGDRAAVRFQLEQQGDQSSFSMSGLPEDTAVHLVALVSKGEGEAEVDLGHLLPRASELEHDFEARVALIKNDQGMHIGMTMNMDMELERR